MSVAESGCSTVTHGPAFTNTVTGLIEGVRSNTPMVLIAGDTPRVDKEHLQKADQAAIMLGTGVGFEQMRSLDTALEDMATAFRRAVVERRPVVLNVPVNYIYKDIEYSPVRSTTIAAQATVPDHSVLDEATGLIASARRPIVLAGKGAASARAREALIALADRIGAPLATTLKGKDLFHGHPFDLGIFGTLSAPSAVGPIEQSDCIVAFGASLNKWTTVTGSYLKDKRVVHCDIDPERIGRFAAVNVGVLGDAAETARAIIALLDEGQIPPAAFRSDQLQQQLRSWSPADFTDRSGPNTVDVRTVLARLEEDMPENRTLVTDGGQFIFDALKTLHVPDPSAFVLGVNFGAIGFGMADAIGAAAAADRPVLLLVGDGGFMLGGLAEFHSAVRAGSDIVTVVFNNGCYGPEYIHFKNHGLDPRLSMFDWPDFASVAEALGGQGMTVQNLDDAFAMARVIARRDRPLLFDVRIDPELTDPEREPH